MVPFSLAGCTVSSQQIQKWMSDGSMSADTPCERRSPRAHPHLHSLRNEKVLAPLLLGHLIKGIERNGLDEG